MKLLSFSPPFLVFLAGACSPAPVPCWAGLSPREARQKGLVPACRQGRCTRRAGAPMNTYGGFISAEQTGRDAYQRPAVPGGGAGERPPDLPVLSLTHTPPPLPLAPTSSHLTFTSLPTIRAPLDLDTSINTP